MELICLQVEAGPVGRFDSLMVESTRHEQSEIGNRLNRDTLQPMKGGPIYVSWCS